MLAREAASLGTLRANEAGGKENVGKKNRFYKQNNNFARASLAFLVLNLVLTCFFFHFSCQEARENCHFSQTFSVFSTFQGSALAKRYFKVSHANC